MGSCVGFSSNYVTFRRIISFNAIHIFCISKEFAIIHVMNSVSSNKLFLPILKISGFDFSPIFSFVFWTFVSVVYAENFHEGVLVQDHMVVICIWCTLFVTSQFDVMSMFPNQRFGEVCWHNNAYFSTRIPLISCVIGLNINYQRFKLGYGGK